MRSGADRDDGPNAAHAPLEGLLNADPQGGELGRALCAGALHGDTDGAVVIHRDKLDIAAVGKLIDPSNIKLTGSVVCQDVSVIFKKFPYKMEHMAGKIDLTENSVRLGQLNCKHNDVELQISGSAKDFGPNASYKIQMQSPNMLFDKDLLDALNSKQKKLWWTLLS